MELRYKNEQLLSTIDMIAYKESLSRLNNMRCDIKLAKALQNADVVADSNTSYVYAFMRDAHDLILNATVELLDREIDTTNVYTWLLLHDMVVCATRLITVPGFQTGDDLSVHDLVEGTSQALDLCMRLTNKATQNEPAYVEDDKIERARIASIYLDIVSGRSGLWLLYIDTMIRQICAISNVDADAVFDSYAKQRMNSFVSMLCTRLYIDVNSAINALSGVVLSSTYIFDAQMRDNSSDCHVKQLSKDEYMLDGSDVFGNIHRAFSETGNETRGYCKIAGVCPISCMIMLPKSYITTFRRNYLQMLSAMCKVSA